MRTKKLSHFRTSPLPLLPTSAAASAVTSGFPTCLSRRIGSACEHRHITCEQVDWQAVSKECRKIVTPVDALACVGCCQVDMMCTKDGVGWGCHIFHGNTVYIFLIPGVAEGPAQLFFILHCSKYLYM